MSAPVDLGSEPVRIAHPAAMVLALLLLRAGKAGNVSPFQRDCLRTGFRTGKRGMDELHEQTVNLLSFQQLPKTVFDSQVAFNLIDRYGTKSAPSLETVENRIRRDFSSIVHGKAAVPSLMLLHAPIFHGHAFSLYIELERPTTSEAFIAALAGDHVEISPGGEDAPSNVNAAGQEQVQVLVRHDEERDNGFWIWAASDNLRVFGRGCGGMRRIADSWTSAWDCAVMGLQRSVWMAVVLALTTMLGTSGCGYHTSGNAVRLPTEHAYHLCTDVSRT